MSQKTDDRLALSRAFERKVRRAKWAIIFEQLWLRLWVLLGIAGVFVLVSLLGVWPALGELGHYALAGLFAVAALAGLVYAARIHVPKREEAIRRIENVSGVPHRPASSYEDTISTSSPDPETMALWKAHRSRMAALLAKLKAGKPRPRTDRYDPFALRALLMLFVAAAAGLMGSSAIDRIKSAFQFGSGAGADSRLDAWISPPPYTGKPPLMLADGSGTAVGAGIATAADGRVPQAPERSIVIVRASGSGAEKLTLEIEGETPEPKRVAPEGKAGAAPAAAQPGVVTEVRHELKRPVTLRVMSGKREMARWFIDVIPDHAPNIKLTKKPEVTARGSMKLTYKVEDDYGVASAQAKLEKAKRKAADPSKAWAQPEPLKGPRWPEQRPPPLELRLPAGTAKTPEQFTYVDAAQHPWAGLKVVMTLEAKDVAGQTGKSAPIELVLPQKRFTKPLALAIVEQRRKLIEDHRYRGEVRKALDALTLEPETFIDDTRVYLNLRTIYHRLENDRTRAGMKSVIKQLWQVALRIEDGDLSDAERRLKEAQDKLAKALEDGASDEEIAKLMQELRQAMNEYMQQLAKEQGDQEFQEGTNPDQQMMSQQDLERMMQDLEDMAKNGSREQAQQLLSEMQDLMERMQAGKMTEKERQMSRDAQEAMKDLQDMAGDQQKLMDETFEELRQQEGASRAEGQQKPNLKGAPGGEKGKQGQNSAPGQKKLGQGGQKQQGRGKQQGMPEGMPDMGGENDGAGQEGMEGKLGQRQRELRDRLEKLQRDMREKGLASPKELDAAREAMENAERALGEESFAEATEQQGEALEQMRKSGQEMAEQMGRNNPSRMGKNGETPRDPLGRQRRTRGPDLDQSVQVPDEIDRQRAREVLDELRRRSGEASRPQLELDYIERLLKRF